MRGGARLRGLLGQAAVLAAAAGLVWVFASTVADNLATRHIATGFGFLFQVAPIPLADAPIPYTASVSSYGRALLVGILNTLRVSAVGCVLATLLGTAIGIGRLSGNWLLARLTAAYVELVRDVPLLLQLLAWYALMQRLPPPRQALRPFAGIVLSNRGVGLPGLVWHPAYGWALLAALGGAAVAWVLRREAPGRRGGWVWLLPVAAALLVWAGFGAPLRPDLPRIGAFNFRGGIAVSPEFAALLAGLVVYTAAYVAEIVRGGIVAVPRGQREAALALGLRRRTVLRRVVLPQAMRLILPPLTSQYLNLVKNSSLAVAIGYQDIVSVAGTTLNQTGQAIEGVAIIMAVYLTISLGISAAMNLYGARVALVER